MGRKRTMRGQGEDIRYLGTKVTETMYNEYHKLAKERDISVGVMIRDLIKNDIEESKKA